MPLNFHPPLLNSANPWATSKEDLQALYDCPYTGAITTRTSVADGFDHNDTIHQYCFVDDKEHEMKYHSVHGHSSSSAPTSVASTSSLNTLGYSPFSTQIYLNIVSEIVESSKNPSKPIIFSVAGTPAIIRTQYESIKWLQRQLQRQKSEEVRMLMEINLSCPNIAGKPPPAYSKDTLREYLDALSLCRADNLQVGIKTPPFTYQTQFEQVISALLESVQNKLHSKCPISFITATNTLGSCLVLSNAPATSNPSTSMPALHSSNGTGIGGLAGSALHPLALGNVATFRRMLDSHTRLEHIEIIGVGGVNDRGGYKRMRRVGASAVAVGTALGVEGIGVFEKIWEDLETKHDG